MSSILKYAKGSKRYIYASLVFVMLSVTAGVFPYFIANRLIVQLLEASGGIDIKFILQCACAIGLLLIFKAVFGGIGLSLSHKGAYGALYEIRKAFSDKMASLPLGEITEKGSGYFKKKLVDDIGNMELTLAHIIPEGIPNLIIPIVVLVIIFTNDWRMGLLSVVPIVISLMAMSMMIKVGTIKMPAYYQVQNKLNNTVVEYISGMDVIKIFGRTTSSYQKYVTDATAYRDYTIDWGKTSWKYMSTVGIILPCTIMLTLPIGSLLYFQGSLALEKLIFILLLDLGIGVPLNRALMFLSHIPVLQYGITELEKTFKGIPLKTGIIKKPPQNYDIRYDQVTFAYNEKNVFEKLSFEAKEKTLTAIVGPSGGGKSTVAKLLVHYWDVNEGSISIGGRDIREYTADMLMDMVSFVSQDNFLFAGSIMDNIRIGKPDATDHEVYAAAKAAACDDFVSALPDGYDTNVGMGGGKLSGGEVQRITIARAILKDAPIVVLDEATAYADAENEDVIQEAVGCLMRGKTMIVIAHRLRSIVRADKIIVIDKGKLVAQGNHEQLLESCNLYQRLWTANEQTDKWKMGV